VWLGVSAVSYRGVLFLPVSVHPPLRAGGEPLLKGYAWRQGIAVEAVLPYSVLDTPEWHTIGLLDVLVGGLRNGQVLCVPRLDVEQYAATARAHSREYQVLLPAEAMAMARHCPPPAVPVKWVCLGWDGRWCGLYGWMLVHVLVGDGSVGRVHLYSRVVEEHPTCASAKRAQLALNCVNIDEFMQATDWAGRLRERT